MEENHFTTNIGELRTDDPIQDHVRDLKPNFLNPQWLEMKNLSAYHQEDFLRNLKLTLILFLVPLLREL